MLQVLSFTFFMLQIFDHPCVLAPDADVQIDDLEMYYTYFVYFC